MHVHFDLRTLVRTALTASVVALGFGAASAGATSLDITSATGWQTFDVDNFLSQSTGVEWIDGHTDASNPG
jgi:hypothetical protein